MTITVPATATTGDPRLAAHAARSVFHLALHRAIELAGMPAPAIVRFEGDVARFVMDENHPSDVDDWAAFLGVPTDQQQMYILGYTRHTADSLLPWHGLRVTITCIVKATDVGQVAR